MMSLQEIVVQGTYNGKTVVSSQKYKLSPSTMLLVSDEPGIRQLGKLRLQLKHFYRSYVEVMRVANPHVAPLLTRI
jgi:hypothetical protein